MYNSQEVANKIKTVAKAQSVTIGQMPSDCSLGVNTLSSMQSGGYYPRLEAICKIADYLNVSVDYLLGRTDIPTVSSANSIVVPIASRDGGVIYKKYSSDEYFKLKEKYPELLEAVSGDMCTLDE